MDNASLGFLADLIAAPSPSGYEQPAAAVYRDFVSKHADEVTTDVMGSVAARLGRPDGSPRVMLAGHMDEIGFMASYITKEGYVAFQAIGGVDPHLLPGQRVRVHAKDGPLLGVIGRMPIHLLEEDERKSVVKMHKLFIDLGMGGDAVRGKVRIGDPITFVFEFETFGDGLATSRGLDDKLGAFVVAEVLRRVAEKGAAATLYSVATVQEEVGLRGGATSVYSIDPDIGIAVEVNHATDYPDVDKRRHGEMELGKGPVISRGANINPALFELLLKVAKAEKIPVQIDAAPRGTGTDANVMQLSRGGKPTALVSLPLRYMHTPSEVCSLADVEATVALLAALVRGLKPGIDFTP